MDAVLAVVLAAGRSRRMGQPKALLSLPTTPPVRALERVLVLARAAGCQGSVVVLSDWQGHDEARDLARSQGAPVLMNDDPDRGMLASVELAAAWARERSGVDLLVWPVDHSLVAEQTIGALLAARRSDPAAEALSPRYEGRSGHPLLLRDPIWRRLARFDEPESRPQTLRDLLASARRGWVDVRDPFVRRNSNTPHAWAEACDLWLALQANEPGREPAP